MHHIHPSPSRRGVGSTLGAAPNASSLAGSIPTVGSWLFLLTAAVALPLLALACLAIWQMHLGARARAEDQLRMQATTLALTVDRELTAAAAVVRTLAVSATLARGDLEAFRAEMKAAASQVPQAAIALSSRNGLLVLTTLPTADTAVPTKTLANGAGSRALLSGKVEITDLYRGPISGIQQIAVAVPVPDASGATIGGDYAVGIAIFATSFQAMLVSEGQPPGWVAVLMDRRGRIIARSVAADAFIGRSASAEFLAAVDSGHQGVLRHHRQDGVDAVTAFARAPGRGFIIAAGVPESIFMAPLWAALRQFAAIGVTLTLLGVGLAALLGTRIVRAIRGLSVPDRRTRAAPRFREVDEIAARLGEAERWRAVLMAEMNHRVKNSLMTVQALAAQTLKGAKDDPVRFQHDFAGRLASLARAHDVLTATGWQAAAIDTVVAAALAPWMAGQARHISMTGGAAFMVAPRQAQVLILALHELATNAAKYGALAQAGGWVVVAVALGTGGIASITWTERGGPLLAGRPERRGFGSRLLERVVPNDLGPGATVALDYAAAGLGATLRFEPMAAQASPVALAAA